MTVSYLKMPASMECGGPHCQDHATRFLRGKNKGDVLVYAKVECPLVFSQVAEFQGVHFKYASRNGITLIEHKGNDRFFYWLS
jgi:hypothetical protein